MKSLIIFFTLFISSSVLVAQSSKKGYLLSGKIDSLPNGTTVYLITKETDTIGMTQVKMGAFKFKGYVEGEADFFFLRFFSPTQSRINELTSNAIWLENKSIKVEGALADIKKLKVVGSLSQNEYLSAKQLWDNTPEAQRVNVGREYVSAHLNSLFIPYFLLQLNNSLYRADELDSVYALLGSNAKNSFYGKELAKQTEINAKTIEMRGLGRIQDFKITSPKGEVLNINELAAKSKYTLIDFWASWCGPCRAAIPKLSKVYSAFRDKGFNIIGVSTDKKKTDWIKALGEDQTPWTHGLDNIDAASSKVFGLAAIPGYILIDQDGRIVQSDLITSTGLDPSKDGQIRTFKDKSLSRDLYQIMEELLKDTKGK